MPYVGYLSKNHHINFFLILKGPYWTSIKDSQTCLKVGKLELENGRNQGDYRDPRNRKHSNELSTSSPARGIRTLPLSVDTTNISTPLPFHHIPKGQKSDIKFAKSRSLIHPGYQYTGRGINLVFPCHSWKWGLPQTRRFSYHWRPTLVHPKVENEECQKHSRPKMKPAALYIGRGGW